MIILHNDNDSVSIHDKWEELTQDEFVQLAPWLYLLLEGKMDLLDFRYRVLQIVSGYERSKKRMSDEEQENVGSNLFILAMKMQFPTRPQYVNPEVLDVVSDALREELQHKFPFEVDNPDYAAELEMILGVLQWIAAPNMNMKRLPMERLVIDGKKYYGPKLTITTGGEVHSDILAAELCDLFDYRAAFADTGDAEYLASLCAALFRENRKQMDQDEPFMQRADRMRQLSDDEKAAVLLVADRVIDFVTHHPYYSLLFSQKADGGEMKKKIDMGMSTLLYATSEKGYGSLDEVRHMPMADFLNLQIRFLSKSVAELRGMGKNDAEIAGMMEMNLETIEKL